MEIKSSSTKNNANVKFIIWLALFMTNFIYLAIYYFFPLQAQVADNSTVSLVVAMGGLAAFIMSFALPKLFKKTPEMSEEEAEQNKFIMSLAFNESTTLAAFMLAYLFANLNYAVGLFVLSIIGFLLRYPGLSSKEKKSALDA